MTTALVHEVVGATRDLKLLESNAGRHLFVVDGSRVFDLDGPTADRIAGVLDDTASPEYQQLVDRFTVPRGRFIDPTPLAPPPLRSLSLNVAHGCNLGCRYCYADEGRFGGKSRMMSAETARASVDRLFQEAEPKVDLVIGFMGGEPMLNRRVIEETAEYASGLAKAEGRRVKFSLTTNGTLLTADDAALFHRHQFSVTVSIDGPKELNDQLRPDRRGGGSYDSLTAGLRHLQDSRPGHLSGRITVSPQTGRLLPVLEHVMELGFDDVGFAPVLVSPDPNYEFTEERFGTFLEHMIECGQRAKAALLEEEPFPFTNFETALHEIHRGTHRPYPCGAGAGYLSTNAEGDLYACHRLIDDPKFAMGSVREGSSTSDRAALLTRGHVDSISPCRTCWARYLCGGGCYHEVSHRGRIACDYIRGWLEFCIASYVELSQTKPEYFKLPKAENDFPDNQRASL